MLMHAVGEADLQASAEFRAKIVFEIIKECVALDLSKQTGYGQSCSLCLGHHNTLRNIRLYACNTWDLKENMRCIFL